MQIGRQFSSPARSPPNQEGLYSHHTQSPMHGFSSSKVKGLGRVGQSIIGLAAYDAPSAARPDSLNGQPYKHRNEMPMPTPLADYQKQEDRLSVNPGSGAPNNDLHLSAEKQTSAGASDMQASRNFPVSPQKYQGFQHSAQSIIGNKSPGKQPGKELSIAPVGYDSLPQVSLGVRQNASPGRAMAAVLATGPTYGLERKSAEQVGLPNFQESPKKQDKQLDYLDQQLRYDDFQRSLRKEELAMIRNPTQFKSPQKQLNHLSLISEYNLNQAQDKLRNSDLASMNNSYCLDHLSNKYGRFTHDMHIDLSTRLSPRDLEDGLKQEIILEQAQKRLREQKMMQVSENMDSLLSPQF